MSVSVFLGGLHKNYKMDINETWWKDEESAKTYYI